jgi:hypothetical protein
MTRISASAIQKHLNAACQCPAGVLREAYHAFDHAVLFRYDLPRNRFVSFKVPMEDLQGDPNELTRKHLDAVVGDARKLLA